MHVVDGVEMVDVREAARLASRSPETIRRWVWSGKLSSLKYGTKLLVPLKDVTRGAQDVPAEELISLAEWLAESAPATGAGVRGATALDLLLEDRYDRAGSGSS